MRRSPGLAWMLAEAGAEVAEADADEVEAAKSPATTQMLQKEAEAEAEAEVGGEEEAKSTAMTRMLERGAEAEAEEKDFLAVARAAGEAASSTLDRIRRPSHLAKPKTNATAR